MAAREAARVKRMEEADQILTAADERDVAADARDTAADKRERDRDLARLLAPQGEGAYGDDWPERRGAARDRKDSKSDRVASRDDRIHLTEDSDAEDADQS